MKEGDDISSQQGSRWELASYLIRDRRLGIAMLGGGLLYFALGYAGLNLMPCPILEVTGLPCPGCGMTRSCMAGLQGNWADVLRFNPFGPVFAVFWAVVGFGLILPQPWRNTFSEKLAIFERRTRWAGWVGGWLAIYTLTRWF
ncbi:MAG: DUF2752 domain-containing protein [Luteolibacter sp.]